MTAGGQPLERWRAAEPRPYAELGRVQELAQRTVLEVGYRRGRRLGAAARQSTRTQVVQSLRHRRVIGCGEMVARRAMWGRTRSSRCCRHKASGPAMSGRSYI